MTATTLACVIPIALACIGILVIMWALCKMSKQADEQNEAMKEYNKRGKE